MDRRGKRFLGILAIACIILMFVVPGAQAQSQDKFPTRSVDIIVPTVPGGGADVSARLIAEQLKTRWGVGVNVVNKPGGNTIVGNAEVNQAKPDGYTVLADGLAGTMILEVGNKNLPFKVLDRTFIGVIGVAPIVMIVPAASPIKNLKDLEAEIKKDPEHFTWGSFGGGSPGDFLIRQFFAEIGVDAAKTKPVAARGGAELVVLVAGNNVKMGYGTPAAAFPHWKAGTVRPIAVTGYRVSEYPDTPTTKEQGYPKASMVFTQGITGPPKMPPAVLKKWTETLQQTVKDQDFAAKMKEVGFKAEYMGPDETKELMRKGMEEARVLWGTK